MEVAELALRKSHYLACTRVCWNVESASRSCNREVFDPGPDAAPARTSKELAPLSTLPLEEIISEAPLRPQRILPPAPIHKTTEVVEGPISATPTIPPPVFKISDFQKIEYIADTPDAAHPA